MPGDKKEQHEKVLQANLLLHSLIANEYDDRQAIFHPAVINSLNELISPHLTFRKGRALDIGAGTAYVPRLLEEYSFSWTCSDVCPEMIAVAKDRFPDADFVIADAFALPFQKESFDLVTISGVLHHVVDYKEMISHAADTLMPGGLLFILNEPNAAGYRLFSPVRLFTGMMPEKRVARHVKNGDLSAEEGALAEYHLNHGNGLSPRHIERTAEACGLRMLELKYTNINMLANLGERMSWDIIEKLPAAKFLGSGRFSIDFNMILEKPE